MAEHQVLFVENPARLKVDTGRLRIEREGHPPAFILPDDIDVLCLHDPVISITVAALQTLTEAGVIVLLTDARHRPSAMLYPITAHARMRLRLRLQIELDETEMPARLWQSIVQTRIRGQAATLRHLGARGALYLERLISKVEPGDAANHEGQAARHYWKNLFEDGFQRRKQGAQDGINARLNFGYAVLRALIARHLAAKGLNLVLGLGHRSSENPFNLADDFIEPFRYLVERHVASMESRTLAQPLSPEGKVELLGFVTQTVSLDDGDYRLNSAVETTVDSYCRILEGRAGNLHMPVF